MFKPGDKVRRKKEYLDEDFVSWFIRNDRGPPPKTFTVRDANEVNVYFDGYYGSWFSSKFELARTKKYL